MSANKEKNSSLMVQYDDGFSIVREERENHPGHFKACLYYHNNKVAVCKDGKTRLKTHLSLPEEHLKDLEEQWAKIASEEASGSSFKTATAL